MCNSDIKPINLRLNNACLLSSEGRRGERNRPLEKPSMRGPHVYCLGCSLRGRQRNSRERNTQPCREGVDSRKASLGSLGQIVSEEMGGVSQGKVTCTLWGLCKCKAGK